MAHAMDRQLLVVFTLLLIVAASGCTAPSAPAQALPSSEPIASSQAPAAPPEPTIEPIAATATPAPAAPPRTAPAPNGPPLLIKSMPIALAAYDPATQRAGDLQFTQQQLTFDRILLDYGFVIPANSAGAQKTNPQPTFIVPLGTKVLSLVDGVVVAIPTLWSNDYSIHVAASADSQYRYETEHVLNPLVRVGDRVVAGQVLAEVSDYDTRNTPGYGLVEMGILDGGASPEHLCPFQYLDPTINSSVRANLLSFYRAWNEYRGSTVYDLSAYAIPGCLSLDRVAG